jgi:hydroxymethylpyrimidine/phosphomethylpyrimidine kinase
LTTRKVPAVLTIAGSDSGGGAGIQADLKTFAAFGVYGTSAITAITAQNTLGVARVHELPVEIIEAQIDAVMSDIGADAIKTGMLASAPIVRSVAASIRRHGARNVVVDPVMVAASGDRLLKESAIESYKAELFSVATIVTPNVPEAEALTGMKVKAVADMRAAARAIHKFGPRYVLLKGGHLEGEESVDVLFDGASFKEFRAGRIKTTSTHGTGCTLSSAIASGLAHGRSIEESVAAAKAYVTEAMRRAFPVGKGRGPLNHLYGWWAAGGSKGLGH